MRFVILSILLGTPALAQSANTWTCLTLRGTNTHQQICYVANPTVGLGHSFTVTGTQATLMVQAWSNIATSTPFYFEDGTSQTSATNLALSGFAPNAVNDVLSTCYNIEGPGTTTIGGGTFTWTITDQNPNYGPNYPAAFAESIATNTSVNNFTWSTTAAANRAAASLAIFHNNGSPALISHVEVDGTNVTSTAINTTGATLLVACAAGTIGSGSISDSFSAPTLTVTPAVIPNNHSGNITLAITGNGTSFINGTTVFTPSGVSGVTKISQTVTSATTGTLVVTTGATTGTLTTTESVTGTASGTNIVAAAGLSIAPTGGNVGTTPTLTLTGTGGTLWTTETPSGLFTVSGGTGASIGTATVTSDTSATAVLTVGTAPGTLTVHDSSTTATATFSASSSSLVPGSLSNIGTVGVDLSSTAATGGATPYTYQWQRSPNGTTGWANVCVNALVCHDNGLTVGNTYFYRIQVTDNLSNTATSGTLTVIASSGGAGSYPIGQ